MEKKTENNGFTLKLIMKIYQKNPIVWVSDFMSGFNQREIVILYNYNRYFRIVGYVLLLIAKYNLSLFQVILSNIITFWGLVIII